MRRLDELKSLARIPPRVVESRPLVLDAEHKESTAVACALHTHSTMPPRRANVNTRKLNRQLQTAVLASDERRVRKAVERGAEVNAVMASGYAAPSLRHSITRQR